MVVTVLPPRPLLSRRTRAMPSPAGITVCWQIQAATGWLQSGQCRPASVENTKPPRAAKDAAFLATGNPLGRTKTGRSHVGTGYRPRSPTQAGAALLERYNPVGASLLAMDVNDNARHQAARVVRAFFASRPQAGTRSYKRSRSVTTKSSLAKSQSAPIYASFATSMPRARR